jgi:predicted CxxxxCH...CXXCH cytochrome family protein
MERAVRDRNIRTLGGGFTLLTAVCLVALLAMPASVRAAHYIDEGAGCYSCHTLDTAEGEPNTSYINGASRTMPLIKAYNGGAAPATLGCTYCHNSPANATMKDALSHFGFKSSKHPVGFNFVGGTETNSEYLTGVGSATANEMDCLDCHDVTIVDGVGSLQHVGHKLPSDTSRTNNPYMLKSVTVAGQYDNLCRICHGSAAAAFKGQTVRVTSHADGLTAITENDATAMKAAVVSPANGKCTACHDTHYSAKVKLFNDGHEGDTAIVSSDCTSVCHYNGDANDNFTKHGHGRTLSTYKYKGGLVDFTGNYVGINLACTSCHVSIDTSDTSTGRKAHVEAPTGGSIQDNYKAKFNINLPMQAFDTGSVFGNPQSGVCYTCHSTYETHQATGGVQIGCQDCHDEHAEGSGTASNYFMIPEVAKKNGVYIAAARPKSGVEAILYDMPRKNPTTGVLNTGSIDFYAPAAAGVCDSTECHVYGGTNYAPLATFAASHSGGAGEIVAGKDCEGCHAHNGDPAGGWRATASCNGCHSYPGLPTTDSDHLLSGVHNRHVEAAPNGYGLPCTTCHFNNNHNQSAYQDNVTVWNDTNVPIANINIRIDTSAGKVDASATNLTYNGGDADVGTNASATHNGTCAGLYCHGNSTTKQADWTGANETPAWGTTDPAQLGCGDCHANPPATPAANGAHTDHLAVSTYTCDDCHLAGAETAPTHVNGSVNMTAALSYTGGLAVGDGSYGTCSTGSCHNATAGTNVAWNVAATNCNQCHYRTAAGAEDNFVGNDKSASMVVAAEWTGYGHGKTAGPAINLACTACHSMANGHDFSAGLNGAGNNPYRLSTSFTCSNTTAGCHVAGRTGPVTGVDISTVQDHDKALMGTDGKRTWPWTPQCANCHDPHGDATNIAMIGNEIYESAALNLLAAPAGLVVQNTAMTFTNTTAGHDAAGYTYADSNAPFSSICQECHSATGTGMLSYIDGTNTSSGAHPGATGGNPGDCSNCHKHASAFKPSGCAGCHGNGSATYWPDTVGSNRTLYPDRAGRHQIHMADIGARMGYGAVPANFTGAQQTAICAFCHNDASGQGGAGHYAGSYNKTDAPADVGSFNQMWGTYAADGGTAATYTPAVYTTDVFTSGTACANVDCHGNKTTPAGYEWYGATATACIMCHDDVTTAVAPTGVSHVGHMGAATTYGITTITCSSCHTSAPAIVWGTPGTQPSSGHIDGTFRATGAVAFTYTGNYPTAFGTCGANACHNDGNGATFAPASTYTWGTAISGCAFCHLAAPTAANHTDHLSSAFGPLFGTNCAGCHVSNANNTTMAGKPKHINGLIEFANVNTATSADAVLGLTAPGAAPDATSTDRCNHCHSTASVNGSVGTVLAKTNWNTGAYTLPCLSCHNGTDPATNNGDGTGRTAPNMLGDDSTYGAEVKGHNLATGSYTDADLNVTNPAANKACNACHDVAVAHLNNADDTSYTGNRLLTTINTVATASTVTGSCNACHATAAGTPATSQVSTHGNVNTTFTALSTHDGNAEQFVYKCEACHEVHGMVNGTGYVNIYMIKPAIGVGVSYTTTPGGVGTTTAAIRFVRVSGTDSYDDGLTTTDNVCVSCHANASRPGSVTAMTNTGGNHALNNDFTGNEQGKSCIGCHSHNYDAAVATADGFAPLSCNGCHTYPGLNGTTPANQHVLSAIHDAHVGRSTTQGTVANKGFACSVCHNGSQHNNAGIANGAGWTSVVLNTHVQVRFDPSWNPATTTAADGGATDSTDFNDTTNTCSNLYCHGATLGAGGTATAPVWSTALTGCTYCHLDTTALNSRSHGPHLTTTTGSGAVCNDCHTAYDLVAGGNHMNGTVSFVAGFTYTGVANDKLPTTGLGSCGTNRCHNNGQSAAPLLGYTWGTAINGTGSCTECHATTSGTLSTQGHSQHLPLPGYVCTDCHAAGAQTAATHANGTVDLKAGLTYSGTPATLTVAAANTFGSCSTGSCHNATAGTNVVWSSTATNCDQCHEVTTASNEENWNGQDKVMSMVVTAEWTGYGHGKTAGPAINLACTACHNIAAAHDTTTNLSSTNPYRLSTGFSCSNTTGTCHSSGKMGPVTGIDVSTIQDHDKALMGTDGKRTWPWTPQCANCHDPHGDGTNLAMIGNEIFESVAFTLMTARPALVVENSAMVFTNATVGQDATGGTYANSASPFSSVCQECHSATGTGMLSYIDGTNTSAGAHPSATGGNPGDCTGCHNHATAFKPSGCTGCHGSGTMEWPQNASSNRSLYPNRAGRHLSHLTDIGTRLGYGATPSAYTTSQQNYICDFCHNDATGVGGSGHYPAGYNKTDAPANVGSFLQMWSPFAADGSTAGTYNIATYTTDTWSGGSTCATVDCHNNQLQPAGYEWYGATASACLMCHTVSQTAPGVHPVSGQHDTAVTTHTRHDDSFTYGPSNTVANCITCHSTAPTTPSASHINGTSNASIGALRGATYVTVVATVGLTDGTLPSCAPNGALGTCHFEQWKPTIAKTWSRLWHEQGASTDGTQCKGCHGTFTQGWRTGVTVNHLANPDGDGSSEMRLNHDDGDATETEYNQCKSCHVYGQTAYLKAGETNNIGWFPAGDSTNHGNGSITMNSTNGYTTATRDCSSTCHANNTNHNLTASNWPVASIAGPPLSCTGCHASILTHRKLVKAGADVGCENCHPGGTAYPTKHSRGGSATHIVLIPNNTTVGINYTSNTEKGIHLGGDATVGYGVTSEAEICWRCHDSDGNGTLVSANDISEWGTNTDTNGTEPNYNFGTLSNYRWATTTSWYSANQTLFAYKTHRIQSVHTANTAGQAAVTAADTDAYGRTETADAVSLIRCSYCHDIHQTGGGGTFTTTGKPWLRGTWMGSPYPEDGAPHSSLTYTNITRYGAVPRGGTQFTQNGGYFIDQNSGGYVTATYTLANSAGLCTMCHGTNVDTMDYTSGEALWVGSNGHAAAAIGGTGTGAANIFDYSHGRPTPAVNSGATTQVPAMGYTGFATLGRAYGYRGSGGNYTPKYASSYAYNSYNWGATVNGTTINAKYHQFPCAKCHNPHASRLPKLMITNCLDINHNSWDDNKSTQSRYTAAALTDKTSPRNQTAYFDSAQNCHRADDGQKSRAVGQKPGWNLVTPWGGNW